MPNGGGQGDNQESFWFAEVLKYFYLIQAPVSQPDECRLGNHNANETQESAWQVAGPGRDQEWVFNTEAHPFRVVRK